MTLLTRNRLLLAKIQPTDGVDPVPTGAADAVLVRNLQITPQATELADRDLVRGYLGNSEQLPVSIHAVLEFEVEMAGHGTAGQVPAWGRLLRACGFAETALASAQTGTAQAGGAATITLAAGASATDNAYRGMTVRTTGGTGSGQSRVIASYVGSTKVATVTEAWDTTPDVTTTYSVDAQVVYAPVSSGFEQLAFYFYVDGVRHALLGARGSVSMALARGAIPVFRFRYMGSYVTVADAANPTPTLTSWLKPVAVNNVNTSGLRLQGYAAAVMASLDIDIAAALAFRTLVGGTEQTLLTDRKPAGSIQLEATTVAVKDWWTAVRNATTGPLSITHGTTAGNKVKIDAPSVQLTEPRYDDLDGVQMLTMGLALVPGSAGNDELVIQAA